MAVHPIPKGYHVVTPYLIINDAAQALDYYKKVFGAKEVMRFVGPGGKVMHAEIKIGDSIVMLSDEMAPKGALSPHSLGGTSVSLMLYVEDVDASFQKAIAAGGKEKRPLADQFYGDRTGTLIDPFGHVWTLATHVEDVEPDEVRKRAEALMQ